MEPKGGRTKHEALLVASDWTGRESRQVVSLNDGRSVPWKWASGILHLRVAVDGQIGLRGATTVSRDTDPMTTARTVTKTGYSATSDDLSRHPDEGKSGPDFRRLRGAQPTVYAREPQMLRDAGYTRSGDYMVPR